MVSKLCMLLNFLFLDLFNCSLKMGQLIKLRELCQCLVRSHYFVNEMLKLLISIKNQSKINLDVTDCLHYKKFRI